MLHKWRHSILMFFALTVLAGLSLFQNCAQNKMESNKLSSTEAEASLEVPEEEDSTTAVRPDFIEKAQVSKITANRILVTNYFISIFGAGVKTLAAGNIAFQERDFGSSYSIYESASTTNCASVKNPLVPCNSHVTDAQTPANISLNIRREAWRIRTCHSATASNALMLYAMKRIAPAATLASPPAISDDNLDKAYQLFFRAKPLPSDHLLDSLTIVAQSDSDPVKKWQAIILSLCLSPHWQVL